MIRAVFFDYDGVLTTDKTGSLTTHRHLAQATGIELSRVQAAFSPYNTALTLGQATHADIWPAVCHALGAELSFDLLREAFESTPLNEPMFALARCLKRTHAVGIITDNKKDRIDLLTQHQGLAQLFAPIVVSAELGSSKEGAAIFQHALARLGMRPEESVFIDNSRANLVAARGLGMYTVFHDDALNDVEALSATLRSLGIGDDNAAPCATLP